MKRYKLHQWLPLVLALVAFSSCGQKNYPVNSADAGDTYKKAITTTTEGYSPPQVISISDEMAKSTKDGEMYYDNEYGYRYWRLGDGKYYLDAKYSLGAKPEKKLIKRHHKKNNATDYAHE